jgi:hypothetical protein
MAATRIGFVRSVEADYDWKEDEMESPKPVTQSPESQTRRSLWIRGILALAVVAALTACVSQETGKQELAPAPTPVGQQIVSTRTVTIKPAQGPCAVVPWELTDVGLSDQVCFTNQTASPIVINFFSTELFGVGSITVPPYNASCRQVAKTAMPGKAYTYSVSCVPDARPRIVIRGQSPDSMP